LKKDWVVWLWCALLFLAGVTWGSIRFKTDFYAVSNVHDLFEIFSSSATIVAVIFAAFSINDWRSQIKAESDHELARKLAVSLERYKESIRAIYSTAGFCVNNCIVGFEGLPPDTLKAITDRFLIKVEKIQEEGADFRGQLVEARALWGDELPKALADVFNSCNDLCSCVRLFSMAIRSEMKFEQQDLYKRRIIELGEHYSPEGWEEEKIAARVNELARTASEYIGTKLVR
jgi:hypothetical protein